MKKKIRRIRESRAFKIFVFNDRVKKLQKQIERDYKNIQ